MPSSAKRTTPLLKHFYKQIRFGGPISIAEYMRTCLTHPIHGYYTTKSNIFGHSGDFITSPYISQVFPELLAVWISHFVRTTSQSNYHLVELGPGTGNLLATLLPTLSKLSTPPHTTTLLEASPTLRHTQKSNLHKLETLTKFSWADTLQECLQTTEPTIFLAQEFLDALPVHIFHRVQHPSSNPSSWRERLVDIDPSTTSDHPSLRFVLSPVVTPANSLIDMTVPKHEMLEISPEAMSVSQRIATHVAKNGGAGLLIDYGEHDIRHASLRALSKHAQRDVLAAPGEHDVTADVNFGHIREAVDGVEGARFWGCISQSEFLLKLGAAERFRVLGRKVVDAGDEDEVMDHKLRRLQEDYDRLVGGGSGGMGEIYKVGVIGKEEDGMPFGFTDKLSSK